MVGRLFFKRNASTILTCIGGAGVVVTAVLTAKATPKALQLIQAEEQKKGEELTKTEKVKVAAPVYIPAMLAGTSTLACIFGANILNKRTQASLISAYGVLDQSYKEYKKKVIEEFGEETDKHIQQEIAKDKYKESDISEEDGKELFFDQYSGRYFRSTIEDVQRAEYRINRDLVMREYATINEFYELLGIEPIEGGDEIGWTVGMNLDYYWQTWIDFSHSKIETDDGIECHMIMIFEEPCADFMNY